MFSLPIWRAAKIRIIFEKAIVSLYLKIATPSYTMNTDRTWVITTIDGKVASVAPDYDGLFMIAETLSGRGRGTSVKTRAAAAAKALGMADEVRTRKCSTTELMEFSRTLKIEDLMLIGTDFQKRVWRKLFMLNHPDDTPKLYSYSGFARLCGMERAVRAVAHAVAVNPVAVIIPCHRIIPKESVDLIAEIEKAASKTIFNGAEIWLFDSVNFGEYSLGRELKRELLAKEFSYGIPRE